MLYSSVKTITTTLFSRVFYLMDMLFPTKKEILLHSEDIVDPPKYLLRQLPKCLHPRFANPILNQGSYELVAVSSSIYFYTFEKTTPASTAGPDTLEITKLSGDTMHDINSILPECEQVIPSFHVPRKFCADNEVRLFKVQWEEEGRMEGRKEGRMEAIRVFEAHAGVSPEIMKHIYSCLNTSSQPQPVSHPQPVPQPQPMPIAVRGNEDTRNQLLARWLEKQLSDEFIVIENVPNLTKTSRYSQSKDDLAFYVKPEIQQQQQNGISSGYCALEIADTENKEEAKESDKHQMIANMNKAAAHIGYEAAKANIIFNKITVYGLLINYKAENVKKAYKMVWDLNSVKATLIRSGDIQLEISDGLSRVTSCLKGALVRAH